MASVEGVEGVESIESLESIEKTADAEDVFAARARSKTEQAKKTMKAKAGEWPQTGIER
ncbi:MAG: hypothetical protein NWT06_04935 [OM182 bacterium]|nr:hypothetical protein [OM182 bacterium]